MDAAARPGRYGHPPPVGPVQVRDRGQPFALQAGKGDQSALAQREAGDGGDTRGDVSPAGGFPGREPGVPGEGQGAVGRRGPHGDGDRSQGFEGVRQKGFGHCLGVVGGGQHPAFGGAQPDRHPGGRLGRAERAGALDELGGDLADVVAGGLVDDVRGEVERGQPGLAGQLVQLPCRRGGGTAQLSDQDALGQFDQGPAVRGRVRRPYLAAQAFDGGDEASQGGRGLVRDRLAARLLGGRFRCPCIAVPLCVRGAHGVSGSLLGRSRF